MSHEHVEGTIRKVLVAICLGVLDALSIAALWPFNPFQLTNGMEGRPPCWDFDVSTSTRVIELASRRLKHLGMIDALIFFGYVGADGS
jgi:hypothetical protein